MFQTVSVNCIFDGSGLQSLGITWSFCDRCRCSCWSFESTGLSACQPQRRSYADDLLNLWLGRHLSDGNSIVGQSAVCPLNRIPMISSSVRRAQTRWLEKRCSPFHVIDMVSSSRFVSSQNFLLQVTCAMSGQSGCSVDAKFCTKIF